MQNIYPILLTGGSGTRLWPLSRKSYPKQFARLLNEKTLFQDSVQRLTSSKAISFEPPMVLTNHDFRFIVLEQLKELGIEPGAILIEPEAKNTAAAILAATISAHSKDPNAVLLVTPTDHVMPDIEDFHEAIKLGMKHVFEGKIVTFGIRPAHAATGYGYLELSEVVTEGMSAIDIVKFVEKPEKALAEQMLASGNFLWNAGIFLFQAQDMIDAFREYMPEVLDLVSQSIARASNDLGFVKISAEPWSLLKSISIDYAIMEKLPNIAAVPYSSKWSDLGGWDAVWAEGSPDIVGNVTSGPAHAIDCKNSLLRSENANQQLVGLGLENLVVVAMPDAVLVANKDRSQDVKLAVHRLQQYGAVQADEFPVNHRPWGRYESLKRDSRFQVKRIIVNPGASLSLQSHHHRSEHWVVVEGTAKVTINETVKLVTEGESVYVPLGAIHRLENPGKLTMTLIEVQIGSYLEEDDIIRYDDVYSRN